MLSQFQSPRVFQANPSALKKRLFLGVGVAGVAFIAWAALTKDKTGNEPFYFAGGITAVIFALRFYLMQVQHGPARLSFAADGISLSDKASCQAVAWNDLVAIRYRVSRGGHFWEIKPRAGATLDFYLDGLSSLQQAQLREVVESIALPNVRVEPFYNPLSEAA